MKGRIFRKASLQVTVERNLSTLNEAGSPKTSDPMHRQNVLEMLITKTNSLKYPASLTDSPKQTANLHTDIESLLSLHGTVDCPLTEVISLVPTEIRPEECDRSENPSVNYFYERAFESSQNHEYQTAIKLYRKVIACEQNQFES